MIIQICKQQNEMVAWNYATGLADVSLAHQRTACTSIQPYVMKNMQVPILGLGAAVSDRTFFNHVSEQKCSVTYRCTQVCSIDTCICAITYLPLHPSMIYLGYRSTFIQAFLHCSANMSQTYGLEQGELKMGECT